MPSLSFNVVGKHFYLGLHQTQIETGAFVASDCCFFKFLRYPCGVRLCLLLTSHYYMASSSSGQHDPNRAL